MNKEVTPTVDNDSKTAIERVYDQLRQKIIRGELAPGSKLKIEQLKPLFGTGASPIREALSLLTSNKLVERIDQRGFRVSPISEENFNEILMLRCDLDALALGLSIDKGDSAWEEKLVLCHHYLSRTSIDDHDEWESRHKDFHMCLIEACDSPILMDYCSQLYDKNIRYRFLAETSPSYKKRDVRHEHEEIFDAVIGRDKKAATKHLLQHFSGTRHYFSEHIHENWEE
jgi:DNA-binding GntR family transcriptional regulator